LLAVLVANTASKLAGYTKKFTLLSMTVA